MKRLLKFLQGTTLDQKRYVGVAIISIALLFFYALSHIGEKNAPVVEASKSGGFKNGNVTSDETSSFYRKKDDLARKQNEKILESQKRFDDRLNELVKRLDDEKTKPPDAAAGPPGSVGGLSGTENQGKKLNRRGQNQSKTIYPLALRDLA